MTTSDTAIPVQTLPYQPGPVDAPQWMNYGDAIRVLGTVAVVVGHVADMSFFGSKPLTASWWVLNFWDAASRWAVPIYIMLSGSLLLDPHRAEAPSKFYRKRLARIGVPLVFWSLFFMWFDVYYTGWRATPDAAFDNVVWGTHSVWQWITYYGGTYPQKAWLNLLRGEPYVHMHFIFRVAGLYAFTPVLRVCLKHVPRPMVISTVVLMLAISSADSLANNVTGVELSAFARFAPFLGYYLIGYLLRDAAFKRSTVALCWLGLLASILTLALGTGGLVHHYVRTEHLTSITGPPSMNMILYDFLSPVRVVMALCAWVVLVDIFRKPWPADEGGRHMLRFWANTTLGLYLIHPIFREMWFLGFKFGSHRLLENGIDATKIAVSASHPWVNVLVGVPVVAILVYIPSLVAAIAIMHIPYVRRIAG